MVFPPIAKEGAYLGPDRLVPKMVPVFGTLSVPLSTLLESSGSSPFAIDSFQERLNRNGVRERQMSKLHGCVRRITSQSKLWRGVSAVVSAVRRFGGPENEVKPPRHSKTVP